MSQHGTAGRPTSPHRYRWLQWFAAADPGDMLLVNAVRATLAVVASVGAVVVLTHLFAGGQQLTTLSTVVFALVGSMLSTVLVTEATIKDQKTTTLLLFLPLACSSVVATLASPVPWLGSTLLLAVIFLAFYVRRFGQRSAALGMAAFLSFLITLSTHAGATQRPWLVITAGLVTSFVYLFRFVILPPRPALVLRRSTAAFTLRAAAVLDQLTEGLEGMGPEGRDTATAKRLRRSVEQLHLSARMIESQLASPDSRRVLPPTALDRIAQGILEADLAVETMAQATVAAQAEPLPADLKSLAAEALRELGAWSRDPDGSTAGTAPTAALDALDHRLRTWGLRPGAPAWAFPLFRMKSAIRQFVGAVEQTRRASMQLRDGSGTVSATDADLVARGAVAAPSATRPQGQDTGLRPTTRLAIKALVASAIGLPLGLLLSPTHPYFVLAAASAVIALSFGSVLEAALQQTVTTFVGSLVGLSCAALLNESPQRSSIIVVLVVVAFFLGVYLAPLSPAWPGFWLAVIFALLFTLAGGLQTARGILADQMLGTFVGCTLGILVALLVFPVARTGHLFARRTIDLLRCIAEQIGNCTRLVSGEGAENDLAAGAHAIETHFHGLASEVVALRYEAGVLQRNRHRLERQLALLAALHSSTRQLASLTVPNRRTFTTDPTLRRLFHEAATRTVGNVDALCRLLAGTPHQSVQAPAGVQILTRDTSRLQIVLTAPDSPEAGAIESLFTLLSLDMAVVELGRELGAPVVHRGPPTGPVGRDRAVPRATVPCSSSSQKRRTPRTPAPPASSASTSTF